MTQKLAARMKAASEPLTELETEEEAAAPAAETPAKKVNAKAKPERRKRPSEAPSGQPSPSPAGEPSPEENSAGAPVERHFTVNVRLTTEDFEKLGALSEQSGISKARLVGEAIRKALARYEEANGEIRVPRRKPAKPEVSGIFG